VKDLKLIKGTKPADVQRIIITLHAEVVLKASRAVREDERSPSSVPTRKARPVNPYHPVDIYIDVNG
jgi:hypothetical protein